MTDEIIVEPIEEDRDFEIAALQWRIDEDIKRLIDVLGLEATKDFIKKIWE